MIVGLPSMGADGPALGAEGVLGTPDGEDAQTLRDRLDLGLRYLANWYKATEGSDNQSVWWAKIDQLRRLVETSYKSMDPAKVFPGNKELADYNAAALAWPALYRELYLSWDALPKPGLLDQAADYFDTLLQTPGYVLNKITTGITDAVGDAGKKAASSLWPFLLVGALGLGAYAYFNTRAVRSVL